VFRADGTIHDAPGYDERTRVIYEPGGVTFPLVPEQPTRDDARRALAELVEPFSEFPFKAECDRAATAALILSQIGRAAIDGVIPMCGSLAPTPGSGKGLLASAATMIPTGRSAPLMSPTDDDEETRKRLLSIALAGDPVVVIDNVDGELGSAPLSMAITAGVVRDRPLGFTKMITFSSSRRSRACLREVRRVPSSSRIRQPSSVPISHAPAGGNPWPRWYPVSEMTLAIDLSPVLLVRVEARAQERGMALTEYVAKLIEEALPAEPNARAVSLLKAWAAEDATDDPAELEARRADWEATKAGLNEGHSSERKLFP
jgi:hypothetical protein